MFGGIFEVSSIPSHGGGVGDCVDSRGWQSPVSQVNATRELLQLCVTQPMTVHSMYSTSSLVWNTSPIFTPGRTQGSLEKQS